MTREEAIKYLKEMKDECNDTIHKVRYVTQEEALEMAIKALEPKTGHWIALENRFELGDRVKCSECGQVFVVGDDVSRHYCPNCGARMLEPQEGEDK